MILGLFACIGIFFCLRRRRRNRTDAAAAPLAAWQMNEYEGGASIPPQGPGMQGAWAPPAPSPYSNGTPQNGWATPGTQTTGTQSGWSSSPGLKTAEPYGGGVPVAGAYTPEPYNGSVPVAGAYTPFNNGYAPPVNQAAELGENSPSHHPPTSAPPYSQTQGGTHPAPHVYPHMTQDERARASEAYGGN